MEQNPYIRKAYEAIVNQDYEQAAEWFEKSVKQEPDNASFHYRYSITLARSDKLAKALEHAERAAALEPDSAAYRMHLNMLFARQLLREADGLLAENEAATLVSAIGKLEEAARLDPLSVEALLVLAVAYRRKGRLHDARCAVADALKLDPEHREANELFRVLLEEADGRDGSSSEG